MQGSELVQGGKHKYSQDILVFHCHFIFSQNSCFGLHDSCFKKSVGKELLVCKKRFTSRALHKVGLPNPVF